MSRCRLRLIPGLLILLLIPVSTPTIAASPLRQGLEDVISIRIDPGYDGRFRAQDWFPLRIEVENNGVDVDGQLVVRPETTDGVINTFSTPISLPNGARKTAFLYIIAQNHTQQVRVELLDPNGLVVTESETVIRSLLPQDQLVMVVSATNRPLDLTSVAVGGYGTSQGNWSIENIPDRAAALDAISLMVINDIDTGTLTPAQEQALAGWVAGGGHMVVAGGPNWEATAAGLDNLLPFEPEDSETVETMAGLETLVGDRATQLSGQTVVATGTVLPGAQVLAISPDDLPLLIRHTPGLGTVDYLVADPTLPPLRNWDRLPDLWVSLMTSVVPLPGWSQGFNDNSKAVQAIQILPGVNLLPEVLAMCAFLGVYIALIGPLNYLVLARLNRRELAWVTIPGFIIVFSVLAWTIGFNLRGDEVTLSRLTVVRSWPDSETARVDQLIGLLSPRRANYDLVMTDERLLRPLQDTAQGTIFGTRAQTNVNIRQTDNFKASDFPVDGGIFASFITTGTLERPQIGGQITISYTDDGLMQTLRGSIRNDSEETLNNPVILARGVTWHLSEALKPGDLETFDSSSLTLPGEGNPAPSRMELTTELNQPTFFRFRASRGVSSQKQSAVDILGPENFQAVPEFTGFDDNFEEEMAIRRQAFLESLVLDQYDSTGRGNQVYLAGWTGTDPLAIELEGANWQSIDTTLYIVELQLTLDLPNHTVRVSPDQFTWVSRERSNLFNTGPKNIRLTPDDQLVFRFTPLPDVVLDEVDQLVINLERSRTYTRFIPFQLWNWRSRRWEPFETNSNTMTIRNPDRFIGPQNAVEVRLVYETTGSYLEVSDISVEQWGTF